MSRDIQVVAVVDAVEIVLIEEVSGSVPRTLRLLTKGGCSGTSRVLINGYEAEDFQVVSDSVLLVTPGALFADFTAVEMSFDVVTSALNNAKKARLLFTPTDRTTSVSGLQKLIQQVTKSLLSRVGSNRFNAEEGGTILEALGPSVGPSDVGPISSAVAQTVSRVQAQYLSLQSRDKGLTSEERLLKLEFLGVTLDESTWTARATIRLISYTGQSQEIPIVL